MDIYPQRPASDHGKSGVMLQNWRLDLSSPLGNWSEIGATESRLIRYYGRESTRSTRASCK
jgi:hypothetical protein